MGFDWLGTTYNEWLAEKGNNPEVLNKFEAFQGGATAGAVSMRQRAMEKVREILANDTVGCKVLDALGELPDFPQE